MASNQITLTASMRNNLLNLQNTQKLFDMTQERLSTGKKVNSALDNPGSYFTASALSKRSSGLETLLDGMGQATQTIIAANHSITTIQSLVDQAGALANNARDTANVRSTMTGNVDVSKLGAPNQLAIVSSATFNIRVGDSDRVVGTKNVLLTQTLGQVGFRTTAAAGSGLAIKVGEADWVKLSGITSAMTVEDLTKLINDKAELKGIATASVVDGKFQIQTNDAKNQLSLQSLGNNGRPAAGTNDIMASLGINVGSNITINAPVATTFTASFSPLAGATAGSTVGAFGMSPTPGKFRVYVGEATVDIAYDKDDTVNSVLQKIATAGIGIATVVFSASTSRITITTSAGKAFRIEDLDGNFARRLGLETTNFIKAYTGSFDELADKIAASNADLAVSFNKAGQMVVESTNGESVIITDNFSASGVQNAFASLMGIQGLADNGANVRREYSMQFDALVDQIDQIVQNHDTSYKGVNLLNGDDLLVNFNQQRTSNLLIKGVTYDAKGLGMNESRNEWRTTNDIMKALADIDTATARLETKATDLGMNLNIIKTREDFTQNMINTLTTGADKLTLADMNEEAANLLALQVRQQLATNALSLASQSQQAVLRLF